jgi:hypothetical protein
MEFLLGVFICFADDGGARKVAQGAVALSTVNPWETMKGFTRAGAQRENSLGHGIDGAV